MSEQVLKDAAAGARGCLANKEVRSPPWLLIAVTQPGVTSITCSISAALLETLILQGLILFPVNWHPQQPLPLLQNSALLVLSYSWVWFRQWGCSRGLSLPSNLCFPVPLLTLISSSHPANSCPMGPFCQQPLPTWAWEDPARDFQNCCNYGTSLGPNVGIICQDFGYFWSLNMAFFNTLLCYFFSPTVMKW